MICRFLLLYILQLSHQQTNIDLAIHYTSFWLPPPDYGIFPAYEYTIELVNNSTDILPNHRLNPHYYNVPDGVSF